MNQKTARLIRLTAGPAYRKAKQVYRATPKPKRAEMKRQMRDSL